MKRTLLGAIVGGILIFAWQFLSWGIGNFHQKAEQYTPKQDSILSYLSSNLKEGGYLLPTFAPNTSREEMEKGMEAMKGKPWATIQYHEHMDTNMAITIPRQLVVDILTVWLFIWILSKFNIRTFGNVFLASMAVGFIVFFNQPYTGNIWFRFFDIMTTFLDCMVMWALVGLWLGWLFNRKPA